MASFSLQPVDCTTQLVVVSRFAEGTHLFPLSMLLTKILNSAGPNTEGQTPLIAVFHLDIELTDHNTLSVTIRPVPYPLRGPCVKSVSLQFRDRDMQHSIQCFAQVQVGNTCGSSLIHRCLATL